MTAQVVIGARGRGIPMRPVIPAQAESRPYRARRARADPAGLTNRANKGSVPANYPPEPYSGATEGGRS